MSDKYWDLIKTIVILAAIIIASLILASAIKEGTHYIGDAIGNGLNQIGTNILEK